MSCLPSSERHRLLQAWREDNDRVPHESEPPWCHETLPTGQGDIFTPVRSDTFLHDNAEEPRSLPRRWSEGTVDLAHYQVGRLVGSGAMGAVFEGHDKRTGQRVALKTLFWCNPESLLALKREFRNVADLVHPNLALAYELAYDEELPYLVMEFVDGVDFLSHVRGTSDARGESIAAIEQPARLRHALHQLVLGVDALHSAGLLHLDLKPANILVDGSGRVVVLDFGLVDAPKRREDRGPLFLGGTPAYMAPELCAGIADAAADSYAIGVVLFQALTGVLPFEVERPLDVLRKQREDAPPVRALAPHAPDDLARLCDSLLHREPAQRPTLSDVLNELGSQNKSHKAVSSAPSSARPFIGRSEQLAQLREAFEHGSRTRSTHVFIGGASGIGKTALLRHFVSDIRDSDETLVFGGRCYEREAVPYKAVDGVVEAMAPYASRASRRGQRSRRVVASFSALDPELRAAPLHHPPPDPHELRQRAFLGLKTLCRKLTASKRVVIAIDDLQWGDLDSARRFREVFGAPDSPPVLLLGTFRAGEWEHSPCLRELFKPGTSADIRWLTLAPLPEEDACTLARLILVDDNTANESLVRHVARESGGSPLFVGSLTKYHLLTQRASSGSLREVISAFLNDLSDDGRRLACLLAVAGGPLPQGVALHAAGVHADRHGVLARLRQLHMVRTSGARESDSVEVYHDRIRESICLELSAAELARIDESLADTLAHEGTFEAEQLAHHYHAAGRLGDAGRYAIVAAERANAQLAFDHAANWLKLATECRPGDADLLVRYAEALERAGRCAESAEVFLQAAAVADQSKALLLERLAARQFLLAGRVEQGLRLLRPQLEHLRLQLPTTPGGVKWSIAVNLLHARVRLLAGRPTPNDRCDPSLLARIDAGIAAVDGLTGGDPMTAASLMLQTFRLCLKANEPSRVAWGLAQYGLFQAGSGSERGVAAAEELLARAECLSRSVQDPGLDGTLLVARARAALTSGAFAHALAASEACGQHFRDKRIRNSGLATVAENVALFALEAMGLLDDLARRSEARLRSAEAVGDLYSRVTALTYFANASLAKNDVRLAKASLDEAALLYPAEMFLVQSWLLLKAQTYLDHYCNDPTSAWERLCERWAPLERSQLLRVQFLRVFATRARGNAAIAALKAGRLPPSTLIASARRDAATLEQQRRPYARAAAATIRAGLAAVAGQTSAAVMEYTRASAAYEQAGMLVESACCRLRRANLPDGSGIEAADAETALSRAGVAIPSQYAQIHAP